MSTCARCGIAAETKNVTVMRSIGLLIGVRYSAQRGDWCRPCIDAELGPATLVTATLGWWSVLGVLLTPILLALNFATFLRTRGMRLPTDTRAASAPDGRGGAIAVGVAGSLVAVAGLVAVALFGYLWAFGTSPDDARFSPVCLVLSFAVCVLPGIGGAAWGGYRALAKRAG